MIVQSDVRVFEWVSLDSEADRRGTVCLALQHAFATAEEKCPA